MKYNHKIIISSDTSPCVYDLRVRARIFIVRAFIHGMYFFVGDIASLLEKLLRGQEELKFQLQQTNLPDAYARIGSPSQTQTPRKLHFRALVADAYYPDPPMPAVAPGAMWHPKYRNGDQLACMLTGHVGNGETVKAAHLVPMNADVLVLAALGMTVADLTSVRNALLLHDSLERMFDRKLVSFVRVLGPILRYRLKVTYLNT